MYKTDTKRYNHAVWTAGKDYLRISMDKKAGKEMKVLDLYPDMCQESLWE